MIDHLPKRLAARADEMPWIPDVFDDSVLIPVPRRSPAKEGSLWPSLRICEQLLRNGFGTDLETSVQRTVAIRSSSRSAANQRPTPNEQYDSLKAEQDLLVEKVTVVDDVVTLGSTMAGVYGHLLTQFPNAEVRFFAWMLAATSEKSSLRVFWPRVTHYKYRHERDYTQRDDNMNVNRWGESVRSRLKISPSFGTRYLTKLEQLYGQNVEKAASFYRIAESLDLETVPSVTADGLKEWDGFLTTTIDAIDNACRES